VTALDLDAWFDDPAYKASAGTFSGSGAFILAKLKEHDAAKLVDVLAESLPGRCQRPHRLLLNAP